mmetsp:Transcript_47724/g.51589  ORF Transcript_47724/g.51589 Transcript_47724/m.51589 type:complete len:172 (+) Transcript_47724:784-1299(+)
MNFGYECIGVYYQPKPRSAKNQKTKVRFLDHNKNPKVVEIEADVVIGADGANIAVRSSLQRYAFGFETIQDFEGSNRSRSATFPLPLSFFNNKNDKGSSSSSSNNNNNVNILSQEKEELDSFPASGVDQETGELRRIGPGLYWTFSEKGAVIVCPNHDGTGNIIVSESWRD